jgi:hypothetical protein
VHITAKQVPVILCINCYTTWKRAFRILIALVTRHMHITSLPHTVHLTYKEFLLVSLSLASGIALFYARSDRFDAIVYWL